MNTPVSHARTLDEAKSPAFSGNATHLAADLPGRRTVRALTRADYERFQPMVRRIAMRLARKLPPHVAIGDLVSSGWVGLSESFHRADPTMPIDEFEAYASHRVKGAMIDFVRTSDPTARATRNASRRLARTIARLAQNLGRAPEEREIATALGLDPDRYGELLTSIERAGMARLEMVDFDDEAIATTHDGPEEAAGKKMLKDAVAEAIEKLPQRLQTLLGLHYQDDCTFREIGAILGVTESRVSQLHTEAMHRLRAAIGRE